MKALLIGATGLVGSQLLTLLLQDHSYEAVTILVRRTTGVSHPRLLEVITDFEHLDAYDAYMAVDVVFSVMGTTIARAGTQDAFRRVDHDYPLTVATMAHSAGARFHVLLSSLGADPASSVFYSRIKGETEQDITAIGFERNIILRPSLLLGERSERRPGEAIAQWLTSRLSFLFIGPLAAYRAVAAQQVATAMIHVLQKPYNGTRIVENSEIFQLANG